MEQQKKERRFPLWMIIFLAVAAVLIVLGATKVICVNHEWQAATCTEPETCARCGKTRGEALGHIPTAATYLEPGVCERCGQKCGEPLGNALFTKLFSVAAFSEPGSVTNELPLKDQAYKGTVALKLGAHGFGYVGQMIDYLTVSLGIDTEAKAADLNVSLLGKNLDLIFAWDNDMPRFTLPASGAQIYGIGKDLVTELAGSLQSALSQVSSNSSAPDEAWLAKLRDLLSTYATPETVTDEAYEYAYRMFPGTAQGRLLRLTLSKEQWRSFWQRFGQIISENDALVSLIAKQDGISVERAKQELNFSEDQLDDMVENMKDWHLILFYVDERVCSFYLGSDDNGILYESQGKFRESGRVDAFGIVDDGEAEQFLQNTIAYTGAGTNGQLRIADLIDVNYSFEKKDDGTLRAVFDLSADDKGLSVEALYTPGQVNIAVPGTPDHEVKSLNEFGTVLSNMLENALSALIGF